ncbi:thioredoxin-disulfide reductase [Cladochytrium tenue]|nr:thioredoxin-disulfide reductase [Cladochytrium tenue]
MPPLVRGASAAATTAITSTFTARATRLAPAVRAAATAASALLAARLSPPVVGPAVFTSHARSLSSSSSSSSASPPPSSSSSSTNPSAASAGYSLGAATNAPPPPPPPFPVSSPPLRPAADLPAGAEVHPVVIVGSGPAAHTAAIYSARANLRPLLFEGFMAAGVAAGGQLTTTTDIENFPGFPSAVAGPELMDRMRAQSLHHGTSIRTETVARVDLSRRPFAIYPEDQDAPVFAHALIIATGATARTLTDADMRGAAALWQRGISACAVCDGAAPIFRNRPVAVLGGGDSAAEEALFLSRYASAVHLLVRSPDRRLRASKLMQQRLRDNPKIHFEWASRPVEARPLAAADGSPTAVRLGSLVLASTADPAAPPRELPVAGLFYAIGHTPNTAFLRVDAAAAESATPYRLQLDPDGYVRTAPGTSLTSVEGVFAAGDVQDKRYRQAVTAAGSGCMAALDAERWLDAQGLHF